MKTIHPAAMILTHGDFTLKTDLSVTNILIDYDELVVVLLLNIVLPETSNAELLTV
jgi:hypothetical protein